MKAEDANEVRGQLESWVPRMFWMHFNEVFGCLGQMAAKKQLQAPLREYLAREKFKSIADRVEDLIASYDRSKKRKSIQEEEQE